MIVLLISVIYICLALGIIVDGQLLNFKSTIVISNNHPVESLYFADNSVRYGHFVTNGRA